MLLSAAALQLLLFFFCRHRRRRSWYYIKNCPGLFVKPGGEDIQTRHYAPPGSKKDYGNRLWIVTLAVNCCKKLVLGCGLVWGLSWRLRFTRREVKGKGKRKREREDLENEIVVGREWSPLITTD